MKLRPFNADKELKKIGKINKNLPVFAVSGIILMVLSILIYQTYAIFVVKDRHNITNAVVGNIAPVTLVEASGGPTMYLGGPLTKDQIKSITITSNNTVPGDAIGSWDVGTIKNGSIMAWYKSAGGGLFDVWIGQNGGVKANPISRYLFSNLLNATSIIGLENLKTTTATSFNSMFYGSMKVTSLDLSSWDTSNVTDMIWMFSSMTSLTTLDVSNFNTSKVTAMRDMFASTKVTDLNLSSFTFPKMAQADSMFEGTSLLTCVDMGKVDFTAVTSFPDMFKNRNANLSIRVKDQTAVDWILARDSGINATIGGTCPTLVKDIAGNYGATVAVAIDGTVWSWGSNGNGLLGNGTTVASLTPVQVMKDANTPLRNIKEVKASGGAVIALSIDGTVWGWGYGGVGQLGNGTTEYVNTYATPVKKDANTVLTNVLQIELNSGSAAAVLTDGTLWMWGNNFASQLGNGRGAVVDGQIQSEFAGQVLKGAGNPLTTVKEVAMSSDHTLARLTDGTVWAWGANFAGEIGDGTTSVRSYATQVKTGASTFLTNVSKISAGYIRSYAILNNGQVWGWGGNKNGALGDGTTIDKSYATQIKTGASTFLTNVAEIYTYTNTADDNGNSLARLTNGTVWAWGINTNGRLGDGTTTNRSYATQVKTGASTFLTNVAKLSFGQTSTMAILNNGQVWGWGENSNGNLGIGNNTATISYATQARRDASTFLTGASVIMYTDYYTAVVLNDNTLWSSGNNNQGVLGDGTTTNSNYFKKALISQ